MLEISAVIPTYNRKKILKRVLFSLFKQDFLKNRYEIIVVDDGSSDRTEEMIKDVMSVVPQGLSLRYYYQENRGPAATRNLGIKMARGEVILLLGDDIIAEENLLEEHMKIHKSTDEDIAVLGYVTWAPEIKRTPFLRYLMKRGLDFQYQLINDPESVSYKHFYTCNISVRKNFLIDNGFFDENFRKAIWEDIDLGYRLTKRGLKIKYNSEAIGYHYHSTTVLSRCRLIYQSGFYSTIIEQKHPGILQIPTLPKMSLKEHIKDCYYSVMVHPISILDYHFGLNLPWFYARLLDYYKFKGMRKGLDSRIT
ncbi:MAG: glycosyltransferase family 2 protein [Candidatus Aminicenantaceae bacterium]